MKTLSQVIDELIVREGGYTDHSADSGGKTNFGITEKTARAYGYQGEMRDMPRRLAFDIYQNEYYVKPKFGAIDIIAPNVGINLMDFGVLAGQITSAKMLQRSLNVLNNAGALFPEVATDGILGKLTTTALQQYVGKRGVDGVKTLNNLINALQAAHCVELAERRPKDKAFIYGWLLNRAFGV